mgnify:CR=1 FL=1|tara:strand:- start:5118 stop:5510 length:393 start_codon:yes stop_codon:yes gene_type:complete
MAAGITSVAALAVGIFGQTIPVYEETSSRTKGRANAPTVAADRNIFGVIQPLTDKKQDQRPTGAKTAGELVLQTAADVYYRDVTQGGSREQRQTFVRHQGEIWRVTGPQDWSNHSGQRRFALTKYVRDET